MLEQEKREQERQLISSTSSSVSSVLSIGGVGGGPQSQNPNDIGQQVGQSLLSDQDYERLKVDVMTPQTMQGPGGILQIKQNQQVIGPTGVRPQFMPRAGMAPQQWRPQQNIMSQVGSVGVGQPVLNQSQDVGNVQVATTTTTTG